MKRICVVRDRLVSHSWSLVDTGAREIVVGVGFMGYTRFLS
jgi:hypothetical protein